MTIRALWVISVVAGLAFAPAAAAPEGPGPKGDWRLEGMRPGDTFSEVDSRFQLRHQVPFLLPPDKRYVLEATRLLPGQVVKELTGNGIDRLEVVFRDDKLRSVRVAYAGKDEILFDEMGAELEAEFGPPVEVIRRGPMSVGRTHGIRLYFWLSIWTWEFADTILTVEGKHYGVDKVHEHPEVHEYVFTLAQKSED